MVPVELVGNIFNELYDRDRPCKSRFEARKEENNEKKNSNFVSGQIFEMII